jgi:hypothetical protein
VQWGAQDAWLTFYLTVEDDNWTEVPWNYGDAGIGLMNVPCLIGAVLGCFYGGYVSDKCMIWFAQRNGGIREAEHRLWFLYPLAVISPRGMLLFWHWHWTGLVLAWSLPRSGSHRIWLGLHGRLEHGLSDERISRNGP